METAFEELRDCDKGVQQTLAEGFLEAKTLCRENADVIKHFMKEENVVCVRQKTDVQA